MGDVSGGEGQMIIATTWWAFPPSQRVARVGKEFFQIFWCVVSPLASSQSVQRKGHGRIQYGVETRG